MSDLSVHESQTATPLTGQGGFPYELLLAYLRGELHDVKLQEQVKASLENDPRWKAHEKSAWLLELEHIAAFQDAEDLKHFGDDQITPMCQAVARSGEILVALIDRAPVVAGWPRDEWLEHLEECV